ncbi:phospholipase effector Tle1 domain-containing protein [Rhodanobacter sp. Col0626]|uniref:phospholipase effector Tle1 domain-containing protein n=1 Tax=Rhodanobacter sp. Col0626 TaxID=3415679 RepID=UPI003CEDCC0C
MSSQDDKLDLDGIRNDGVSFYPADVQRLQSYVVAEQQLAQFQAPVLIHAGKPHERLYVAAFDGTGNDKTKDPQHETNVGKISDQIKHENNSHIQTGYVAGPGTQSGWLARTYDGMTGHTYSPRMEEMYKQFVEQARKWKQEDPQAEIRLADVGFSRGSEQAAGFARMVHERGIQDPTGAVYTRDSNNMITGVTYSNEPLMKPGEVAQAEMLFDAVGTGEPEKHDRRPPPSVISGLQIIATDERRNLFKSDHIIDPGQTPDGRFLGVTVAGVHSDVGGSYFRDGLAARSDNLAINYLNALSDKPFLKNVAEPTDPRLNVVHRSEEGMFIYRVAGKIDRTEPEGYNERLVPREREMAYTSQGWQPGPWHERPGVADPYNAEPLDKGLSAQFERQSVRTGQPLQTQAQTQTSIRDQLQAPAVTRNSSVDDMFEGLCAAAAKGDCDGMRSISGAYLESSQGQAWLAQGQQFNLEAQAQQAAQQQTQQQAQQSQGFGR